MRNDIRRRLDAHVRASGVCARHTAIFDATAGSARMRAALDGCAADVVHQLAVQEHCIEDRRAATAQLAQGRRALRDCAKAFVAVARVVEINGVTMSTMKLPGSISDSRLLACMRAIVDRIAPYEDAFVANGMAPGLLQRCEDELTRSVAAKHLLIKSRQQFTASTQTILGAQDRARRAIDVLEAIAVTTPAANRDVLTTLRTARRIGPRAAHDAEPAAASLVPSPATDAAHAAPSHARDEHRVVGRGFVVVRMLARAFAIVFPIRENNAPRAPVGNAALSASSEVASGSYLKLPPSRQALWPLLFG